MTIEREGGDRTMDDDGGRPGPRPAGAEAPQGTPGPRQPLPYENPPQPLPYEGVWRFTAPAVDASVPQARHAVRTCWHARAYRSRTTWRTDCC